MQNPQLSAVPPASAGRTIRLSSIDALRGLVMLLMMVDHVRETFFLHRQVGDPMNIASTGAALFFTRFAAHFCAPAFVFLTGLSAWLYAHPAGGARNATGFLLKRGSLLVLLELTLVNFAWAGRFPPPVLYLQVIWVIGLSMIALALLHRLPRALLLALGVLIVAGHNTLDAVSFAPGSRAAALWTILEQRGFLVAEGAVRVKVSYPLLPWIGIIVLGYGAGPLFAASQAARRRTRLLVLGALALLLLALLRGANLYGERHPWEPGAQPLHSAMAFLNLTKYPPSLAFALLTLGVALLMLAWLEGRDNRITRLLATFGGAPMFYYLLHLYALLALQVAARALTQDAQRYHVDHVWQIWLIAALLPPLLYLPCRWFGAFKRRSKQAWVRYF